MLEYWGFKNNPFTRDLYFRNMFHSDDISHIIDGVNKEINRKRRLILILGDKNSGKTYLNLYLTDHYRKTGYNVISVKAKPYKTSRKTDESNIFSEKVLSSLEDYINRNNDKHLLFIDNAHYLKNHVNSDGIIKWFQNISMNKNVFFRVILTGEPGLLNLVDSGAILKNPFAQFLIDPMGIDETKEYIRHKVKAGGAVAENVFSDEALDEIYDISGGVPGKIDNACLKSLIRGEKKKTGIIDRGVVAGTVSGDVIIKEHGEEIPGEGEVSNAPAEEDFTEKETDEIESNADKLLYDELISFSEKMFKTGSNKTILSNISKIKKYVIRIIDNMSSPERGMLMMTRQETPDNYLIAHTVNVCVLAIKLGMCMGYERYRLIKLGVSAFLHDIGMVDVYPMIDRAAKLSVKEIMKIMKHPTKGKDKIKEISEMYTGEDIDFNAIYQHHERVDGSGYPQGLEGNEIDEFARIIGIVDVYEALTHKRKHRDSIISTEAMSVLVRTGDNKYGADVVKALVEALTFYPVGGFVSLTSGEIARVVRTNSALPMKPVVKLMYDKNGSNLAHREIDLAVNSNYAIKNAVDMRKKNFVRAIDEEVKWSN